jgi:hypothetical protein
MYCRPVEQALPETTGRFDCRDAEFFQVRFMLGQHDRMATIGESLAIAVQDDVASQLEFGREVAVVIDDFQACGQSHRVVGVGQRIRFIEVIDAP